MAMVIKNNISAQHILNTFNNGNQKLEKAFSKVASGMKIVGAGDDASGYAISEKMREKIRSFDQDSRNVQNGQSLLKIAVGGIENIVEELRTLKELAIKSANDTNTDSDRLIIQKEFSQRMANINDIAMNTNYNSKILLDGTYSKFRVTEYSDDLTEILCPNITDDFSAVDSNTTETDRRTSAYGHPVDSSFRASGLAKVYANFDNVTGDPSVDLHDKGFSIFCGGCDQYINIIFDGTTDKSTYNGDIENLVSSKARQFRIGIKGVSDAKDLPRAMFEGIKNAQRIGRTDARSTSTATSASIDSNHDLRIIQDPNDSSKYYFSKSMPELQFFNGVLLNDSNTYTNWNGFLTIHHGPKANQAIHVFINDMRTKSLGTDDLFDYSKSLGDEGYFKNESDEARYNALSHDKNLQKEWLQTVFNASAKTLDDINVVTRHEANVAIRVLDGAIEYALNEATNIGAYLQRLDYTDMNIVTMNENVQSAESTFRDADMAKEMTEYTKFNVLQQAAQSMLAQANQSASSVLGLLQ